MKHCVRKPCLKIGFITNSTANYHGKRVNQNILYKQNSIYLYHEKIILRQVPVAILSEFDHKLRSP